MAEENQVKRSLKTRHLSMIDDIVPRDRQKQVIAKLLRLNQLPKGQRQTTNSLMGLLEHQRSGDSLARKRHPQDYRDLPHERRGFRLVQAEGR